MFTDRSERYCIIGAGSSGLAAAKNLKQHAIAFDVIEAEADIGGNWNYGQLHSSVYRSTHLISSKPLTEYNDFPMPVEFPDYPHQSKVLEYLRSYARAFDLYRYIEFKTAVERLKPSDGKWAVQLNNGEQRLYRGVIIANGHNWDPKFPNYPGQFSGIVLHSAQYKTPEVLRDRRVLVVGAGNSGCDIAVESAQNASRTYHSARRAYYYVPKYVFGKPADQVGELALKLRLPLPIRRAIDRLLLAMIQGNPQRFGLPKPDHKLFETHPIINSQMLYYLGHGDIIPKPDVQELCGDHVRFKDGSEEKIEVIIYATGFNLTFPFVEREFLNWRSGKPEFFLHVFHPDFDNLFIAGLIQPDSGQFGLVDYQTQLIAKFIHAQEHAPQQAAYLRKLKAGTTMNPVSGIRYVDSTRHYLEIEHFNYRRRLQKLIRRMS